MEMESCSAMEFPQVAMKKNSFVSMELGGPTGIPNRYMLGLVLQKIVCCFKHTVMIIVRNINLLRK